MFDQARQRIFRRGMARHAPTFLAIGIIFALIIILPLAQPSVSAQINSTPTPLPLFALPDAHAARAYSSNTLALASDGLTMVAANMVNNSMTIFVPTYDHVVAEVPTGKDPRSVALTPDGTRALVTNHGDGTLAVVSMTTNTVIKTIPVGVMPYGVVTNSNDIAYVSLEGSNQIAIVDLDAGRVSSTIDVPPDPTGLTLWGDFL